MVKKEQTKKKHSFDEKQIAFKLFISIIFLIVITILAVCAFKLFESKKSIVSWSNVKDSSQYTYMKVSRMSEKFAYDQTTNIGYHFVIEKEKTGIWHTYLIAINEDTYDKYKTIIDYTYERTTEEPKEVKVYGYPVMIDTNLKSLAIKNITKFVPAENEIEITESNFENYLTNSYLDSTIPRKNPFDYTLFTIMILLVIVLIIFIVVLFHKDKNIKIEQNIKEEKSLKKKQKRVLKNQKKKNNKKK